MRISLQLKGTDALTLRTKKLIEAARMGAKEGVSEGGLIVEEEARVGVPVDTGNLRDHIHSELVEAGPDRFTVAVLPAYEDPNPYGIDPAYARRIEHGFVGQDSLGRHYNQAAQPFMRTAGDTKVDEVKGAIKGGIYGRLDEAMVRR